MVIHNVGLIVEENGYSLALYPSGEQKKFSNSPDELRDLLDYLRDIQPRHIVVPKVGTDVAGENSIEVKTKNLVEAIRAAHLPISEAIPWQARYYLRLHETATLTAQDMAQLAMKASAPSESMRPKQPGPQLAQGWPPYPLVEEPERTDQVWRYVTFVKFMSLLDSSALFFSRADLLGDAHEGAFPSQHPISPVDIANLDRTTKLRQTIQKMTYVNCWYLSEYESVSMWNQYADSTLGIAIKTTYGRLFDAIAEESLSDPIYFSKIRYIDYQDGAFEGHMAESDFFTPYLYKRREYEHEREFRMITNNVGILNLSSGPELDKEKPLTFPPGLVIKVDLPTLIEQVYVSPNAPSWFLPLVESMLLRFQISGVPVRPSALSSTP